MLFSESESARFGLRVFRHTTDGIDQAELLRSMLRDRADVVILRTATANQAEVGQQLDRVGVPYLTADTLIYYSIDLSATPTTALRNPDLTLVRCTSDDRDELRSVVESIFPDYKNHYSSNPLLGTRDILAGFTEWAESYIEADGRVVFFADLGDTRAGFATCSLDGDEGEGVLYGVLPDSSGKGVYTDIIHQTREYLRSQGCKTMKVSTQVQNVAVQRAWIREGFSVTNSVVTFHLNPLFHASQRDPAEFDFVVSREFSEKLGEMTGDRNAVHFDPVFARGQGYEDAFASGLVVNGMLSEFFGMQYPGPGTVFSGYSYRFYRPLYYGRSIRARISFPVVKSNGYHRAVVSLSDSDGLCLLAYCDLFKRDTAQT